MPRVMQSANPMRHGTRNANPTPSAKMAQASPMPHVTLQQTAIPANPAGRPMIVARQALAQRPGVVKSRDALMDAAYDEQVYVDDRTIDSHIKRLRKKFKMADNDFDMIETLYGVGYRFRETA